MEQIVYAGTHVDLPNTLINEPDLVKSIVSAETWNKILSREQKIHLLKLLPRFPKNDTQEKISTLKRLFNGDKFGAFNPLDDFAKKIENKELSPGPQSSKVIDLIVRDRSRIQNLLSLRLEQLRTIIQNKKAQGLAITDREISTLSKWSQVLTKSMSLEKSAEERTKKLVDDCEQLASGKPTLSAQNGSTDLSDKDRLNRLITGYRALVRASSSVKDPSVNLRGITMARVIERERRDKQEFGACSEHSSDSSASDSDSDDSSSNAGEDNEEWEEGDTNLSSMSDVDSLQAVQTSGAVEPGKQDYVCPTRPFANFFLLLREFFLNTTTLKLTTVQVEERVREWQEKRRQQQSDSTSVAMDASPSIDAVWLDKSEDWVIQTVPALRFLCAESGQFVPCVEFRPRFHLWHWLIGAGARPGLGDVEEDTLSELFGHWMTVKETQAPVEERSKEALDSEVVPPAYCPSDWIVRSSTHEERADFRRQEAARFSRPHRSFCYRCVGNYRSVVGPIRSCASAPTQTSNQSHSSSKKMGKARGHVLLRQDRPSVVNLVEIIRDAVARLPNGQGSRADIITLAMDSGYWVPNADSKQMKQCISSALDRLQCESTDPPVRYNASEKIWIYRHRYRSPSDFEQLHQQREAMEKAKKIRLEASKSATTPRRPFSSTHSQPSDVFPHSPYQRDRSPWEHRQQVKGVASKTTSKPAGVKRRSAQPVVVEREQEMAPSSSHRAKQNFGYPHGVQSNYSDPFDDEDGISQEFESDNNIEYYSDDSDIDQYNDNNYYW